MKYTKLYENEASSFCVIQDTVLVNYLDSLLTSQQYSRPSKEDSKILLFGDPQRDDVDYVLKETVEDNTVDNSSDSDEEKEDDSSKKPPVKTVYKGKIALDIVF